MAGEFKKEERVGANRGDCKKKEQRSLPFSTPQLPTVHEPLNFTIHLDNIDSRNSSRLPLPKLVQLARHAKSSTKTVTFRGSIHSSSIALLRRLGASGAEQI